MRMLSVIIVAALAASLAGCVSYHRHEREERVVEHRTGSYRVERYRDHGGGHRHHDYHRHHHDRGGRYHPRGR